MIKNFTVTKNKFKKSDKQPDYRISIKVENGFDEIGGCWIKEDKTGGKYFSCKLNDTYVDHTKNLARKGYTLTLDESNGNNMPPLKDDGETIDADQIPF